MRNQKFSKLQMFLGLCLLLSGVFLLPNRTVYAADDKIKIHEVNYEEEEIIVENGDNTKIYFANDVDASKGNWEVMNADKDASGEISTYTTIDFSWVSPTTEGTVMVKGDKDTTPARIILRERTRKLEVSISYTNMEEAAANGGSIAPLLNIMSSAGTGDDPIDYEDLEWKKGADGKWKEDINTLTIAQLEKFQIKGADLYFRIKAINDTASGTYIPDGSKGRRPSYEVKVKITKKATPLVTDIDGEEFTAEIKYGKEYRVKVGTAAFSNWKKITDRSVRYLPLSAIVSGKDGLTPDTAFPEMTLEIRTYATSKAAASKTNEIQLNAQRILTGEVIVGDVPAELKEEEKDNIYLTYSGVKYLAITIPMASATLPYEYCVVKGDADIDLERASWTSITRSTATKVLSSKAVEGGTIYIRQKEIKSRAATKTTAAIAFELASTCVTKKISYPSVPQMEKQNLTYIKKSNSPDLTFDITLSTGGKEQYENSIKYIRIGTRDIEFKDDDIHLKEGTTDVYIMTVTLLADSLEGMTNCYNRALSIYFEKGTTDKTSIYLTIKDPTPAGILKITPKAGTITGTTTIEVETAPASGNKFVYKESDELIENVNTEIALADYKDLVPNITLVMKKYVTIYEINSTTNKVVKFKSFAVEDTHIAK